MELPAVVTTCDKGADKSHFLYHNNTDCGGTFPTFSTIVEVEGGILFKLKFFYYSLSLKSLLLNYAVNESHLSVGSMRTKQ